MSFIIKDLSYIHADKEILFSHLHLSINSGDKIALTGNNGCGKSTLMRILAGDLSPSSGTVLRPEHLYYVPQHFGQYDRQTIAQALGISHKLSALHAILSGDATEKHFNTLNDDWNVEERAQASLDSWGLDGIPLSRPMEGLSGGEKTRIFLAGMELHNPTAILLDEPTNHLDAESIDWLEQHLQQYAGTVICITHDRYFLDHVAGWILELDRGEGIPWKGNYSSWLDQKTKRMAQEEKQVSKRRKTLERELEWINMAPKARHAKGKARLNSYEALLNEDQKEREAKLEIFIPNGPRLGNKVIEAQHVAKAFGDKLLFDDLNFMLPPNGIVGVIGPNGAGKTTLFKMIMGMESIDKGTFEVGETVQVGYADQTHKDIDPKKTVYQVVSGGQEFIRMGGKEVNARAYLSKFNFAGADQEKLCGVLSGGERNRLHLALTLKADANVLLLDEPTNDIDVNTLRALEEGLENFAGCAVVVSHDRWFLDRICTHILSFEGDSNVVFYEGTYSEYEEYKRKTLGDAEPKRVRYRKLIVD